MILGICGAKGSGKSTLARYLMECIPNSYVVSLADPMKEICKQVFGFTDTQLWGPSSRRDEVDPEWGFAPRVALQKLGTEWGRALHEDVWLRYIDRTALGTLIIPDIRFDNEAKYIISRGGQVVHLTRNAYPWYRPDWTLHPSERGVAAGLRTWTIDNKDFSLKQLRNHAEGFSKLVS